MINKPAQHSLTLVTTGLIRLTSKTRQEKKGLTCWRRRRVQKDAMKDETGEGKQRERLSNKTDKRAGLQVLISEKDRKHYITTI